MTTIVALVHAETGACGQGWDFSDGMSLGQTADERKAASVGSEGRFRPEPAATCPLSA